MLMLMHKSGKAPYKGLVRKLERDFSRDNWGANGWSLLLKSDIVRDGEEYMVLDYILMEEE